MAGPLRDDRSGPGRRGVNPGVGALTLWLFRTSVGVVAYGRFADAEDTLFCGAGDDVVPAIEDLFRLRFPDMESVGGWDSFDGPIPKVDELPPIERLTELLDTHGKVVIAAEDQGRAGQPAG